MGTGVFEFIKKSAGSINQRLSKPDGEERVMSIAWSEEIDSILGDGLALECLGIRNWALVRNDAIRAIEKLEELEIPVLGGDVYNLVKNFPEQMYDSWHCDQGSEESILFFVKRSSQEAKMYISKYPMTDALFSIVPKV